MTRSKAGLTGGLAGALLIAGIALAPTPASAAPGIAVPSIDTGAAAADPVHWRRKRHRYYYGYSYPYWGYWAPRRHYYSYGWRPRYYGYYGWSGPRWGYGYGHRHRYW